MRKIAMVLLLVTFSLSAAAPKKKSTTPVTNAPDSVPHSIAQFLRTTSRDGARQVTFRATAIGTRFFFEEPSGVTVYAYRNGNYVKEEFLRGVKLAAATKRYANRR
ncbi:MAG TPA: hypothetical protein VF846_22225 [Thermoanaerobaculia bacterium]|jgi:hypothetical protein